MQSAILIDKASAIVGNDYKLAQTLQVTPQKVSDWRHGRKPCPPDVQAVLASLAGENPSRALVEALGAKLDKPRRELLYRAMNFASHNPWFTELLAGAGRLFLGAAPLRAAHTKFY